MLTNVPGGCSQHSHLGQPNRLVKLFQEVARPVLGRLVGCHDHVHDLHRVVEPASVDQVDLALLGWMACGESCSFSFIPAGLVENKTSGTGWFRPSLAGSDLTDS